MTIETLWVIKEYDDEAAEKISRTMDISSITARLLTQRGISDVVKAQEFFTAGLDDLSDPYCLPGMKAAVERIHRAGENSEEIVIYGDYDVDGICSVVIVKECMDALGYRTRYYVPDRFTDGYGLNTASVERLAGEGCHLMITVDCGIKSVEEVARAEELGMDVVITDHHLPDELLPDAAAIVNPRLGAEEKNRHLCGAGVAYQLVRALGGAGKGIHNSRWLELAAMATVADIVPLLGDNRVLVRNGLKALRNTDRIGLQSLMRENNLMEKELAAWHISFVLAPRLNSAGRLDSAARSIELLLAEDRQQAEELAGQLNQLNSERKTIEEFIYKEAVLLIENNENIEETGVLVLDADDWHHGVTGIVASRLCEKYYRPVILICWEGDYGKGSCRSIDGIDINAALSGCREYLTAYGGHPLAAGLSLKKENYVLFKQAIQSEIRLQGGLPRQARRQLIDMEVDPGDIGETLMREMEEMEPFGEGNPSPVFLLRTAALEDTALIGKQQTHFKARLEQENLEVIAFNQPQHMDLSPRYCLTDLIFSLQRNEFRGRSRLQLRAKDIQPSYRAGGTPGLPATVRRLMEKTMKAINIHQPVVYVFPTYRNLKSYQHFVASCFRPRQVQELHGHLPPLQRTRAEQELTRGQCRLFMVTEAYLWFYLKHHVLPECPVQMIQVWPHFLDEHEIMAGSAVAVDRLPLIHPLQQMAKIDCAERHGKRRLVYTNRGITIKRLQNQWGGVAVEAGVHDPLLRKKTRRQFLSSGEGALLLDSMYVGTLTTDEDIDEIIFADVPFSGLEAMTVLQQVKNHARLQIFAAFSRDDINNNRDYLNRLYPNLQTVRAVWNYLKGCGKTELQCSTEQLCQNLASIVQRDFKAFELGAVMQILSDLGLCHNKKKGSIMAIKLLPRQKATLDINSSPYYLEGQAEKAAYEMLVKEINEILLW